MIKKLIQKPHLFFFSLIPISIILGFIFKQDALKIAYYGGNITVNYWNIFLISSVFFCLIGLNYYSLILVKKKPKKWLTLFHLLFQSLAFMLFIIYVSKINSVNTMHQEDVLNFLFFISIILFILSIFIHLINFFVSLLLKNE